MRCCSLHVAVQVVVAQISGILQGELGARRTRPQQSRGHFHGEFGSLPLQITRQLHDVEMRQRHQADVVVLTRLRPRLVPLYARESLK